MSLLSLEQASARIDGRTVLDGVDLTLRAAELVVLCGPNGAGKSSVIRALAGLLPLVSGRALAGIKSVHGLSPRQRAERVAYLPQEQRIAWNMPAREIAALGTPFLSGDDALTRADAALVEVGAGHLGDRGVAQMSGGERARVLLARALVADAGALLADEPVAGLDPDAQLLVLDRLKARARAGQGVLVSLHDLTLAARYADRIVVIDHGRMVADDTPMQALNPMCLLDVFGIRAGWVDAPSGPLLDAVRPR